MNSERPKPVIVVGIGNILRSDDGIGVRLARRLQEMRLWRHVEFVEVGTSPLAALDLVAERPRAVFIDAARMGKPRGTLQRLGLSVVASMRGDAFDRHEGSVVQLLCVLAKLGRAPLAGEVFCIEPETVEYGAHLSARLHDLMPRYVREIGAWLHDVDNAKGTPSSA